MSAGLGSQKYHETVSSAVVAVLEKGRRGAASGHSRSRVVRVTEGQQSRVGGASRGLQRGESNRKKGKDAVSMTQASA